MQVDHWFLGSQFDVDPKYQPIFVLYKSFQINEITSQWTWPIRLMIYDNIKFRKEKALFNSCKEKVTNNSDTITFPKTLPKNPRIGENFLEGSTCNNAHWPLDIRAFPAKRPAGECL